MKLFTVLFDGHYPVGACGIVLCNDKEQAIKLFESEIQKQGLLEKIDPENVTEVDIDKEQVIILNNGDY